MYFSSELFDNFTQQDAHEFFNYLLNAISETLAEEKKRETANGVAKANGNVKKVNPPAANNIVVDASKQPTS